MSGKNVGSSAGDVPLMAWEQPGRAETSIQALRSLLDESDAPEGTPEEGEPESEEPEGEADDAVEADEAEAVDEAEDEEQDDSDEEEPEVETYEVTVDGKKVKVTLDELKKSYSFVSHNTRKSQELAEKAKAIEAETAQARTYREQYAARLELLNKILESGQPEEPDWDKLERENPAAFAAQWAAKQRHEENLRQVREEQARVWEEQQAAYEQEFGAYLETERARLLEAIPAWQDEAKAKAGKAALMEYAMSTFGYTPEELGQVSDHRIMVILRKAMLFDQQSAKGQKTIRDVQVPKVLKPGAAKSGKVSKREDAELRRAKDKLAKTGDVHDAAALFKKFI